MRLDVPMMMLSERFIGLFSIIVCEPPFVLESKETFSILTDNDKLILKTPFVVQRICQEKARGKGHFQLKMTNESFTLPLFRPKFVKNWHEPKLTLKLLIAAN